MIHKAVPMKPAVIRLFNKPRRDIASTIEVKPILGGLTRELGRVRVLGPLEDSGVRGLPWRDELTEADASTGVVVEKARWFDIARDVIFKVSEFRTKT